jgi:hypothetical protein
MGWRTEDAGGLRTRGIRLTCRMPGPGHHWHHSTGRSSDLRLRSIPGRPSRDALVAVTYCPGLSPITAAALRRILTGFPFRPPIKVGGTRRYLGAHPIARAAASQITKPGRAPRRMERGLARRRGLRSRQRGSRNAPAGGRDRPAPLAALALNDRHSDPPYEFRWRMMEA